MCNQRVWLSALLLFIGSFAPARAEPPTLPDKLPITELPPSKLAPNLCLLKYRITTNSPECQAFFDQGLGYFYSYVWMEAARSFETATIYDPHCALAWWGLSRAQERWGRGDFTKSAKKAHELLDHASHREQQLIIARMQEKGLLPDVGDSEKRKQAAIATIDNLLALYGDDEEGWYYRAQLAGGAGLFGGVVSSVPFYQALLRINPLHPGANHELVHFYEGYSRPALGWEYSERYIQSSPGIPHPWHMQSHLATRLGRWDKSSSSSTRAVELERAYHTFMNVKPRDDHQFSHHLEVLMLSLTHDGRFQEADALKKECEGYDFHHWQPWFRLAMAERDWDAALKIAEGQRKGDKGLASYMAALVYLAQGDIAQAMPHIDVLEEAFRSRRNDKTAKFRVWETRGLLLCATGCGDDGLKLLAKLVSETKDDYHFHAWGNGAYYMETWGLAALRCGKWDVAEEGLLEALAHDSGSVRGALGLQVLCEHLGREDEARRYAELAKRFWKFAPVRSFDAELAAVRQAGSGSIIPTIDATITEGKNP